MATSVFTVPGGVASNLLPFPRNNDSKLLAASVAESFTVPAGTIACLISATALSYARVTGTAAVPTDISDGTASFPVNLTAFFQIAAGATLSVISETDGAKVVVSWYSS